MDSKTSIPKFGSFKRKENNDSLSSDPPPKTSASHPSTSSPKARVEKGSESRREYSRRNEDDCRSGKTHKRRDRARSRSPARNNRKYEHRESKRDRSKEREPSRNERRDQPAPISWDDSEAPYFIDRRGDRNNLKYGGLDKRGIPLYRRAGQGYIIGYSTDYRIEKSSEHDGHIVLSRPGSKTKIERRLLSKSFLRNLGQEQSLPTSQKDLNRGSEPQEQFISISTSRKRKRGQDSLNTGDEKALTKRDGYGWRHESTSSESSDTEELEKIEGVPSHITAIKQRNIELQRQTKTKPSQIEPWLQLADHQEHMVRLNHASLNERLSRAETRNVSEIKIGIFQEALRNVTTSSDARVKITLRLLEESGQVWEKKKVAIHWQKAVDQFPDNVDLWMAYLDFSQTNFIAFHMETAREHYLKCLRSLHSLIERNEASFGPRELSTRLFRIQFHILSRLTRLLAEAGYYEQALAIWQSIIEYSLFKPDALSNELQNNDLDQFEQFWDSEVPRVGEPGALGWKNSSEDAPSLASTDSTPSASIDNTTPFSSFHKSETLLTRSITRPGRTTDVPIGNDDPYHVVLYSDISQYLPYIANKVPPGIVMDGFLAFLDLPPLLTGRNVVADGKDPFLRFGTIKEELIDLALDSDGSSFFARSMKRLSVFPMKTLRATVQDLFADAFDSGHEEIDFDFIRLVLEQIALNSCDEVISEYCIAFTAKRFPQSAAATAKALLKRQPSSLRLFNAYALLEARAGNRDACDRVFSTALRMSSTTPSHAQADTILLWHTWVWEKLRSSNLSSAYSILHSIAHSPTSPVYLESTLTLGQDPAAVLKTQASLSDGRDYFISSKSLERAVLHTDCLAVFTYLHGDRDITGALAIFESDIDLFTRHASVTSEVIELLHQNRARLLEYHASTSSSFKPATLRHCLTESLGRFPSNTLFMTLFAANESRFRIDDRVRSIMDSISLSKDDSNVVTSMFAIFTELRRGEYSGSTAHSIRATFEQAAGSSRTNRSPSFWTTYVQFEARQAAKQPSIESKERAKRLFFRGLTYLPWCKHYMLLAFSPGLINFMTSDELRRVWNVMVEKELRVFLDLEEVFAKLDDTKSVMNLPEDEDSSGG